jgi:hypothetical protein
MQFLGQYDAGDVDRLGMWGSVSIGNFKIAAAEK